MREIDQQQERRAALPGSLGIELVNGVVKRIIYDGQPDISVVENAELRPRGENCFQYIFGTPDEHLVEVLRHFGTLSEAVPGAVAFYFLDGKLVHVGVVDSEGYLVSKWGNGPVYKHHPQLVPDTYGEIGEYRTYSLGFTRPGLIQL